MTQPILITGATGTLGRAFARICAQRDLGYVVLTRQEMDIANPASVESAVLRHRPWAIINASGYVNVDQAEHEVDRCFRENVTGPSVLAQGMRAARDPVVDIFHRSRIRWQTAIALSGKRPGRAFEQLRKEQSRG